MQGCLNELFVWSSPIGLFGSAHDQLMIGYLGLCAMALDAVDTLSDEEHKPPEPQGGVLPKAKPKGKAKATPKSEASLPVKPKASPVKKKPSTLETPSVQACGESVKSVKKTQMKRPAAASEARQEPSKVSISKGLYKNGMYGFKINGS